MTLIAELELRGALAALAQAQAEIERLRVTLRFYASPRDYLDAADESPISVPDFYDEFEFGAHAQDALAGNPAGFLPRAALAPTETKP